MYMKEDLTTEERKLYNLVWNTNQRNSFQRGYLHAKNNICESNNPFYLYGQTVAKRKINP